MKIETGKAEFSAYSTREWIVDFETGGNGEPEVTLSSIAQDIRFALSTERYKYPIMGANFGATFDDLIGTDYNYIRSEIARRIKDALSTDDRILSVGDFDFQKVDETGMLITCIVKTSLGDVPVSTTVITQ